MSRSLSEPVTSPAVSIVIAAYNEGQRVFLTVEALAQRTDVPFEVIVVDDGSSDGCCDFLRRHPASYASVTLVEEGRHGAATARNLGARRARGPVLAFLDAHCFPSEGWLEELTSALQRTGAGIVTPCISIAGNAAGKGYGMTLKGPDLSVEWLGRPAHDGEIPIAGAACTIIRRDLFTELGEFDAMRVYGLEDVELSLRCWLAGYSVVVEPKAEVAHFFKERTNFLLSWTDYTYNGLRTAVLHFEGSALGRILAELSSKPAFAEAMSALLSGDVFSRRERVVAQRRRSAAWLCERFGIPI